MNKLTNSNIRKRLLTIVLLIAFCFTAILFRLIYLQVINAESITYRASSQWSRDLSLMATRGEIVDRSGIVLAGQKTHYTLYVRPNAIRDKAKLAKMISDELDLDYEKLLEKISKKGVSEITVKKKLTKQQMMNIASYNLDGMYFGKESVRYFPYGDFMTQVLGFNNADGMGQSGLEQYYNKYLRGTDGKILTQTDLVGKELDSNVTNYISAIDGMNLRLTTDYYVQTFAERAVRDAMMTYSAKGASCLVMSAKTGEIYALAEAPSFDLNNVPRDDVGGLFAMSKSGSISNVYEPGSTFKILTSAIGLEEGVANDSSRYYCNGARIVDGKRIKCWQSRGHGSQSFAEGVCNSCNCVFMDVAAGVGVDKFYDYMNKFGVNKKTGVDMLGESAGLLLSKNTVKPVDLARIGFGQAIALTPIGLASSVSACINGGKKVTPHIMQNIYDKNLGSVATASNNSGERIISQGTSDKLRTYLFDVVSKGSGKRAYVPGYKIGGKTGTAQKYANGGIAQGKYVSSFLGFTEVNGDELVCLMIVDEPQGYVFYGSIVAAPYVGDIFRNIFAYYDMKPKYTQEELKTLGKTFTMPNLMDMSADEAIKLLKKYNITYEYTGDFGKVARQFPAPNTQCPYNTVAYIDIN